MLAARTIKRGYEVTSQIEDKVLEIHFSKDFSVYLEL